MIGHAQADGLALGMQQAPRQFLGAFQDEGITARRGGLQQAILAVVHPRIGGDLGQVAAHQCEMMALIDAADAADSIQQGSIAGNAGQRVGGVGGQRDEAATAGDLGRLLDQARLWMFGVNMK